MTHHEQTTPHAAPAVKAQDLKQTARQARTHLEREVTAQVSKALARGQAATAATLAGQQKDLHRLEAQVERLSQRRSGGGFPWGLLLLAGGAYALYRSNPTVREQVQDLLKRVNPGPEGNLARAGDAAKDAVSKVTQGDNPRSAVQAAGGELGRAGEKSLDHAQDKAQDAKGRMEEGAQDLKRDANQAANSARDDVKRP